MKRSTCLTTCGVGCGVLLLIAILLAVAGWVFTRDSMRGIDATIETGSQLDERYGAPEAFTPWPDGAIPAERMEAFLRVRDVSAPARRELAGAFASFPPTEEEARELESKPLSEQFGFLFGASKTVMGLPKLLGGITEARNRALLDAGMGLGEYTHVYVMAYRSWLRLPTKDGDAAWAGDRVRRTILEQLRGQLAALPAEPAADLPPGWRETLAAEIAALEADPLRIPWQDGLPERIAASLEPFRERLEAAYDPAADEFELSRVTRRGMTIHGD